MRTLFFALLLSVQQELDDKQGTPSEKKYLELLNVSYDPTREFYDDYNAAFTKWWKEKTNQDVFIVQSHGGSAKQARAVITGLEADVVTLATALDIDAIETKTGLVGKNWQERLPHKSVPYYSTIVFLVRKGNPKGIKDWNDLVKTGVRIILPNPKTSGGAKWAYMAAWGWAKKNRDDAASYMKEFFKNAPILDTGARGASTTFIQRGIGDVLITWENEAYLSLAKETDHEFEMVYPSVSIQADPPVTWLEGITKEKGTQDVAEFYLKYLYSKKAQELIAKHCFRPFDEEVLEKYRKKFPAIKMFKIEDFGGWETVEKEHFRDGAFFDSIYPPS